MRAVGEFCVHPGQGVCLVENVVSEPTPAYVLSPIGQKHPVQIVFPLDQEFRLRDLMTRDEATNLVDMYPQIDSISIAKTFRARIDKARSLNKKPPVSHERIFKMASNRGLYELITALNCTIDEIQKVFSSRYGVEIGKA